MNILTVEEAKKYVPFGLGRNSPKCIIITGVTGQDGSFMADYLLRNTNHILFGGVRRLSVSNHENIEHLRNSSRFHLINFDLTDAHSISQVINQLRPDYFINFAAQSFVKSSWDFPVQTWETNTTGVLHILEAIRSHCPSCRFYNAGSSEEFGDIVYSPQDEKHPMRPQSPYGASKVAARQLVRVYRKSYGLYAVQGWLFNHEGTRRGNEFVTRKITAGVSSIAKAISYARTNHTSFSFEPLELGNIHAKRDWSDAEDMVDAVWRMLNQENHREDMKNLPREGGLIVTPPGFIRNELVKHITEYVVSSGECHTVKEFVEKAFDSAGIDGHWEGKGVDEKFIMDTLSWPDDVLVQINPAFYRPAEVESLWGDSSLIRKELQWIPSVSFEALVDKMVKNDLK